MAPTTRRDNPRPAGTPRARPLARRLLVGAGVLMMAYAVVGALLAEGGRVGGHLLFLAAVLIGHDAVLLPVAIAVGALIGRFVPAPARAVVRVAAYLSVILTLVALPLVLGYGRSADNPSALPLPYGRNLALVLAGIWLAALGAIAVRALRRHRAGGAVHRSVDSEVPSSGGPGRG